jgi:hypothetical protein
MALYIGSLNVLRSLVGVAGGAQLWNRHVATRLTGRAIDRFRSEATPWSLSLVAVASRQVSALGDDADHAAPSGREARSSPVTVQVERHRFLWRRPWPPSVVFCRPHAQSSPPGARSELLVENRPLGAWR